MSQLKFLELRNFRNHTSLDLELHPGFSLIRGPNGVGKTNLIEAAYFLARGAPLRSVAAESLIQTGQPTAAVRGEFLTNTRSLLVEAELPRPPKRLRMQVNRQALARRSELHSLMHLTTFLPSHMSLVQGGPDGRRAFLDDVAASLFAGAASVLADYQGVLRQRNALLRKLARSSGAASGGPGGPANSSAAGLDVWDEKLIQAADQCLAFRMDSLDKVSPYINRSYQQIAGVNPGNQPNIQLSYQPSWQPAGRPASPPASPPARQPARPPASLAQALKAARAEDLRRGYTTIGPHRDDITLRLDGQPAKTHASQGEQRTLALALRLALHHIQTDTHQQTPLLLLDDVLSELDDQRSIRLLKSLPAGQILITSAVALPADIQPDNVIDLA